MRLPVSKSKLELPILIHQNQIHLFSLLSLLPMLLDFLVTVQLVLLNQLSRS